MNEIRQLIANGHVRAALDALAPLAGPDYTNDVIMLKARWSQIESSSMMGVLGFSEERTSRAQITHALLTLIEMIERQNGQQATGNSRSVPSSTVETVQAAQADLKVLFISGEVIELDLFDAVAHKQAIDESQIDTERRVKVVAEYGTPAERVPALIREHKPDIVHFSMHGEDDRLVFRGANGASNPIGTHAFTHMFNPALCGGHQVKAVIITACLSVNHARAARRYVPVTLGMNGSIPNTAAVAFIRGFYREILETSDFRSATEQGRYHIILWKENHRYDSTPPVEEMPVLFDESNSEPTP